MESIAKKLKNIELTSSNDCITDDHFVSKNPENFLPQSVENLHEASNISQGLIGEASKSDFLSEDPSSDLIAHETLNGSFQPLEDLDENDDQDSTISPVSWVHRQMISGVDPRTILGEMLPKGTNIPSIMNDGILWRLIVNMLSEPRRSKLENINTLDDAVTLLKNCKKIIVLTGAGVSVSCGIPDFRSRDGIYARLKNDYPALPDPQAMFDIQYFRRDPRPFFKFAKEIYPGQFEPSPSHRFIKVLEKQNKLLRNYSQNIDTLEHAAGIENVITCHGSFATASCTICKHKVDSSFIKEDIFNQTIPYCPVCPGDIGERGIMKPDIVFFGEGLSDEFHEAMAADKEVCDLLIVVGSSLKVRPVAMIPSSIAASVPQILINREPLEHLTFDIELLGDCDVIIGQLCKMLEDEWEIDKKIPRFSLEEIRVESSGDSASEVNNNSDNATELDPRPSVSQNEESNSCDRGFSAIKLEDSQDSEHASAVSSHQHTVDNNTLWPAGNSESLSKRIPDQSYLFFPPNRYVFSGAEVYDTHQDPDDEPCSTPTDYSSDCESPSATRFETTDFLGASVAGMSSTVSDAPKSKDCSPGGSQERSDT